MTTKELTSENCAVAIDVDLCLACGSCEFACSEAHAEGRDFAEALTEGEAPPSRIRLSLAEGHPVPVQCRHCDDAPCIAVCSPGALCRDSAGRVMYEQEKCISCRACERVCPFEAISWDAREKTIVKCDVCSGLIQDDQQPFCVVACPTGCLHAVAAEDLHGTEIARSYDSLIRDESRTERAGPDVRFEIDSESCICCNRCARNCPVDCISGKAGKQPSKATDDDREKGKVGEPFVINQQKCIRCGTCLDVCPAGAVQRL